MTMSKRPRRDRSSKDNVSALLHPTPGVGRGKSTTNGSTSASAARASRQARSVARRSVSQAATRAPLAAASREKTPELPLTSNTSRRQIFSNERNLPFPMLGRIVRSIASSYALQRDLPRKQQGWG